MISRLKLKLICFLSLLLLTTTGNNCLAVTLFAGASHAEYLPPVSEQQPPKFRPLQSENPGADWRTEPPARPAPSKIIWVQIPKWMAGQWTKRGDLTVQVTDPHTGYTTSTNEWTDDAMTLTFGHILDKEGNIWHAYLIPSERDGYSGGTLVRFITTDFQPIQRDETKTISRSRYLIAQSSNPNSNYLMQEESLNQYQPVNEEEIDNYSSNRIYSYDGRPMRQGLLVSRFKRDKFFTPITQENGIELMPAFKKFLMNNGMQNLVPE